MSCFRPDRVPGRGNTRSLSEPMQPALSSLMKNAVFLLSLIATGLSLPQLAAQTVSSAGGQLRTGWELQSSASVPESGEVLSTARYRPHGWYSVEVPSTVVAAL